MLPNTDTRNTSPRKATWVREELLHLLTLSGTLAGFCITSVALFHTLGKSEVTVTIADDLLAISAFVFLLCIYTIFFCLRTQREKLAIVLERLVDTLFLIALTAMVGSGFIMVYTLF